MIAERSLQSSCYLFESSPSIMLPISCSFENKDRLQGYLTSRLPSLIKAIEIKTLFTHSIGFLQNRGCLVRQVFFQSFSNNDITGGEYSRCKLRCIHRVVDSNCGDGASFLLCVSIFTCPCA